MIKYKRGKIFIVVAITLLTLLTLFSCCLVLTYSNKRKSSFTEAVTPPFMTREEILSYYNVNGSGTKEDPFLLYELSDLETINSAATLIYNQEYYYSPDFEVDAEFPYVDPYYNPNNPYSYFDSSTPPYSFADLDPAHVFKNPYSTGNNHGFWIRKEKSYIKLMRDIEINGAIATIKLGNGIYEFNGNYHTISNGVYNSEIEEVDGINVYTYGLIPKLRSGQVLKNLKVENCGRVTLQGSEKGDKFIAFGGLVGESSGGIIENCIVENMNVTIGDDYYLDKNYVGIGGIFGGGYATVRNCSVINPSITLTAPIRHNDCCVAVGPAINLLYDNSNYCWFDEKASTIEKNVIISETFDYAESNNFGTSADGSPVVPEVKTMFALSKYKSSENTYVAYNHTISNNYCSSPNYKQGNSGFITSEKIKGLYKGGVDEILYDEDLSPWYQDSDRVVTKHYPHPYLRSFINWRNVYFETNEECATMGFVSADACIKEDGDGGYLSVPLDYFEDYFKISTNTQVLEGCNRYVEALADPGYRFDKWEEITMEMLGVKWLIGYSARFKLQEYTITYDLGGGTLQNGQTNPSSYNVTSSFKLNNPVKEGYDFKGWTEGIYYTIPNDNVTIGYGFFENLHFVAVWELKHYKVEFN